MYNIQPEYLILLNLLFIYNIFFYFRLKPFFNLGYINDNEFLNKSLNSRNACPKDLKPFKKFKIIKSLAAKLKKIII